MLETKTGRTEINLRLPSTESTMKWLPLSTPMSDGALVASSPVLIANELFSIDYSRSFAA